MGGVRSGSSNYELKLRGVHVGVFISPGSKEPQKYLEVPSFKSLLLSTAANEARLPVPSLHTPLPWPCPQRGARGEGCCGAGGLALS
jgi:hypothetical protein